jgi:phosphoserine phosphatase SerB
MTSKSKLAVFDMDGTIIDGRLIDALSTKFGLYDQIKQIQADPSIFGFIKTQKIASLLKGIDEKEIIFALESIPIMNNFQNTVSALKESGYKIGIITDSYSIAAKTLANNYDLDFYAANDLIVNSGLVTGEVCMPLGWDKINCFCKNSVCKRYHLETYANKYGVDAKDTVAIGDTRGDLCMVTHAGIGIAFMPKDDYINKCKYIINRPNISDIFNFIK